MTERIVSEQLSSDLEKSRRFEASWRIIQHPTKFSYPEVVNAAKFISENTQAYFIATCYPPDPDQGKSEISDKIFAGLLHYNIRYPDNVENRTFKEN